MEEEAVKSLDRWKYELKTIGRKHWYVFYEEMLGAGLSSPQRFSRLINMYGEWIVFDAIISSSKRELTGDPFNYIAKVTHEKWKLEQQETDDEAEYLAKIKRAKETSLRKNEDLELKISGKRRRGRPKKQ